MDSYSVVATADMVASTILFVALIVALVVHFVGASMPARAIVEARLDREAPLPLFGKTPIHAVYRALVPIARGLGAVGISPNTISIASAIVALPAAWAFATGHFGIAAAIASIAALADGLDGLVARLTGTSSRFGQVLDTTIDRYVDALFVGGIALYVRADAALLTLALAAIVGGFMVSYASSVERERGLDPGHAPMRRAHRLALLIVASACGPLFGRVFDAWLDNAQLVPVLLAVGTIAIVGNVSAVGRLIRAGESDVRESSPTLAHPIHHDDVPVSAHEGE